MRILFVDDDPMVLEAIQNNLRKQRKEWDMSHVTSGEEALKMMKTASYDIVVSDMRMPGMDGAELLIQVQRLYPTVTRIILTGQADRASLVRAMGVTHRFIGKPCHPDELRTTLERISFVRKRLSHPRLRAMVGTLNALPPVPSIYQQFMEEIQKENTSIERISAIAERDPSIAAKVLQIANSAVFNSGRSTSSIRMAATMVGFEVLRSFVLAASVFTSEGDRQTQDWLTKLQDHCLQVASITQEFVTEAKEREDCYTAGLLHDIGYVVLRIAGQNDSRDGHGKEPPELRQEARWSVSHAEVGGYVLGTWGIPMEIVEAVTFHESLNADPPPDRTTLAVHVAERVAEAYEKGLSPGQAHFDWEKLKTLGIDEVVRGWLQLLEKDSNQSSDNPCRAA